MNLIIVTNPELGWDCVMAVYDASKISEDDVKKLYSEECVTHYTGITKAPKKKKVKLNTGDIKVLEDCDSIGCIIDSPVLEADTTALFSTKCGHHLNPKDFQILGKIVNLLEPTITDTVEKLTVQETNYFIHLLTLDLQRSLKHWEYLKNKTE